MAHLIKGTVNIRKCTGHYYTISPGRVIRSPSRMTLTGFIMLYLLADSTLYLLVHAINQIKIYFFLYNNRILYYILKIMFISYIYPK